MAWKARTPDPQWEFALLVRAALRTRGRYVVEVDTRDADALVEIHRAAREAGRLMGVAVTVELSPDDGRADRVVTATVRYARTGGLERVLAKDGLQRLLESVRQVQGASAGAMTVPCPRQPGRTDN